MSDKLSQRNNMRPKADLVLRTRNAQGLFNKAWNPGKIGLKQFAVLMRRIYRSYKNDDPYAHWVLLHTYKKLYSAIERCKMISNQMQAYFDNLRGVRLRSHANNIMWSRPLNFANFCSYLGAELLGVADIAFYQLENLHCFGLVQTGDVISESMIVDLIQEVYSFPMKWKYTGVTRKDIKENSQQGQDAKIKLAELLLALGELPADVLDNQIEFSFLS